MIIYFNYFLVPARLQRCVHFLLQPFTGEPDQEVSRELNNDNDDSSNVVILFYVVVILFYLFIFSHTSQHVVS